MKCVPLFYVLRLNDRSFDEASADVLKRRIDFVGRKNPGLDGTSHRHRIVAGTEKIKRDPTAKSPAKIPVVRSMFFTMPG